MQIRQGAGVFTTDGQKVGTVDRVVVDPRSKEVTHLIVRRGLIFSEDRVMPVNWLQSTSEERVVVRGGAEDWTDWPDYQESYFVWPEDMEETTRSLPEDYAPPVYWYPLYGVTWGDAPDYAPERTPRRTQKNLPARAVEMKEGASVFGSDGQHVGHVERVYLDPETKGIVYFLVRQALKPGRLIPIAWVDSVGEDEVQLVVEESLVEKLPEFK